MRSKVHSIARLAVPSTSAQVLESSARIASRRSLLQFAGRLAHATGHGESLRLPTSHILLRRLAGRCKRETARDPRSPSIVLRPRCESSQRISGILRAMEAPVFSDEVLRARVSPPDY